MERDMASSATIKTDTGSKVLPGDKHGLPYEVWAMIFSYLNAEELCRASMVCKTWYDLVLSLDHTKWKDLYLHSTDWRHPFWPLNLHCEPISWRQAYKEQYLASAFWMRTNRDQNTNVTCMSVFKRKKIQKTITVGIGKEHATLKNALAVANEYDRILIYPGIYDEQFEMSSKIPFEIVGCGGLGSVILVVCIEQTALTGRVSNLVFRAPWFTNFILKVRAGYLQVDNCIMEDGMVYVQNPGSVCMTFCTFRHATILLQHVNSSIIQNCEFSQTDSAAITVEGFPKDEKNWTHKTMISKIVSMCSVMHRPERLKSGETVPKSAFSTTGFSLSTATTLKKSVAKQKTCVNKRRQSLDSASRNCEANRVVRPKRKVSMESFMSHDTEARSCDMSIHSRIDSLQGAVGGGDDIPSRRFSHFSLDTRHSNDADSILFEDNREELYSGKTALSHKNSTQSALSHLSDHHSNGINGNESEHIKHETVKYKIIESFVSDCAKYSSVEGSGEATLADNDESAESHDQINNFHANSLEKHENIDRQGDNVSDKDTEDKNKINGDMVIPPLNLNGQGPSGKHGDGEGQRLQGDGHNGHESVSSSEGSLHSASGSDLTEDEDVGLNSDDTASVTSSSSDESFQVSDNDSEFFSSEESVIMLTCPDRHQPRSLSAQKEYADIASINSQNQSEHIDIIQDTEMTRILDEARGCFIHKCRITQSKGGAMVSLQGHAILLECEINSVTYGIRCIQNSKDSKLTVAVLLPEIPTLLPDLKVVGNILPPWNNLTLVLKNEIHHCRTSGIFMRLAATGLITGNDIHSNCEAGIDIRKNADPIVQCNRIHHGKRSGVVVLGSGRGQIRHNDIYQNKEAGVYILYRGNPSVSHNQIYSGRAAGIAVNEGGRGYIHDNVITGNQWGGIDIRHGGDPIIHHNTVCNGVSDGIVIGEGGRGSIENNIITGNTGCGIWVMAAHQPLIHGNEIHSNRDAGISLVNRMDTSHKIETMEVDSKDKQSQHSLDFWSVVNDDQNLPKPRPVAIATIEYNQVYHNIGRGISVNFGDSVLIQCNTVQGNKGDGVTIEQPSPVEVKDNYISYNTGSGVNVASQGKVELHGNGIYDNKDYGVLSHSEAEVYENDILGNGWSGIHLSNIPNATVKHNRIQTSSEYAVCLVDVQSCAVENNKFYTKTDHTINSAKGSSCTVMGNQILPTPATKSPESKRNDQPTLLSLCDTRWLLTDPVPKPHIELPPKISYNPAHHVTSITRVTVPSDNCEQGSRFCMIL